MKSFILSRLFNIVHRTINYCQHTLAHIGNYLLKFCKVLLLPKKWNKCYFLLVSNWNKCKFAVVSK